MSAIEDMDIEPACNRQGCTNDATLGIRTQRPARDRMWTKVYWEVEHAPASAELLCRECAANTLLSLLQVLG